METDEVRKKRKEKLYDEKPQEQFAFEIYFVRFGNGNEGNEKLCQCAII